MKNVVDTVLVLAMLASSIPDLAEHMTQEHGLPLDIGRLAITASVTSCEPSEQSW
ncbi:MAG: hypothetical protein ACI4MJ_12670 [Aristaeellaceae bacterium]